MVTVIKTSGYLSDQLAKCSGSCCPIQGWQGASTLPSRNTRTQAELESLAGTQMARSHFNWPSSELAKTLFLSLMINFFFPTKIAYFPTKYRFPHMYRFPHNMQISPVPYTIFPTRYVRIARSTFGMGGADLGAGAKVAAKLKCLLCHWADDLHRFSPFFRPPFQSHPLQTATARAGSRARSVTDAAVGCRAL